MTPMATNDSVSSNVVWFVYNQDLGSKFYPVMMICPTNVGVIVVDRPGELLPSLYILWRVDGLRVFGTLIKSFKFVLPSKVKCLGSASL